MIKPSFKHVVLPSVAPSRGGRVAVELEAEFLDAVSPKLDKLAEEKLAKWEKENQ